MSFIMRLTLAVLIFFIVEFYFYRRTKKSIRAIFPKLDKTKLNKIFRAVIIFTNLYPALLIIYFVYLMVSGSPRISAIESPFFDWFLVYPFWISVLIIVQSTAILIPIDLFRLILFPLYKKHRDNIGRKSAIISLIIISASVIYVPVRVAYDYHFVSTRVTEVEIENLHEDLEDFKITLIADTQADWYTDEARIKKYIETAISTHPDLVLIAGDIITGTPRYIEAGANAFKNLTAPYGVYTCVGDHDNWAYREDNARSLREISAALKAVGVEMVDDDNRIIKVDSAAINISFVTYTYSRRIEQAALELLSMRNGEHDLDIFMTHQPNEQLVTLANELNYDLYFAGHTHGGQLTILFPFINLTPTLMETNYVKGNFSIGDMELIVNRGLGMSIAPVRYNSTPEVTVIVLKKKNQ
jgi:predicted MPP superfamily phosphohydrolase